MPDYKIPIANFGKNNLIGTDEDGNISAKNKIKYENGKINLNGDTAIDGNLEVDGTLTVGGEPVGGGKLYNHRISFYDISYASWNLILKCSKPTVFTASTLFDGSGKAIGAIGTRNYDGTTTNVVVTRDDTQEFEFNFYETEYVDTAEPFTDYVTEA